MEVMKSYFRAVSVCAIKNLIRYLKNVLTTVGVLWSVIKTATFLTYKMLHKLIVIKEININKKLNQKQFKIYFTK